MFRGASLSALCQHAVANVYGIDTFGGDGTPAYYRQGGEWIKWWENKAGHSHDFADDLKTAHLAAPTAEIIVGDTARVGREWDREPVGLLYVDADHSYEGVKRDFEAWSPNLAPGAVVIFDDYRHMVRGKDHYPGVTHFVDSLDLPIERIGKAALVRP